jgi:hypothetical protein
MHQLKMHQSERYMTTLQKSVLGASPVQLSGYWGREYLLLREFQAGQKLSVVPQPQCILLVVVLSVVEGASWRDLGDYRLSKQFLVLQSSSESSLLLLLGVIENCRPVLAAMIRALEGKPQFQH